MLFCATLTLSFFFNFSVPALGFMQDMFTVDERAKRVHIPIYRYGDVNFETSVICYTSDDTALVTADFTERPLSEESRVTFSAGERVSLGTY